MILPKIQTTVKITYSEHSLLNIRPESGILILLRLVTTISVTSKTIT